MNYQIFNRLQLFLISIVILFNLVACKSTTVNLTDITTDISAENKEYGKETFYAYYIAKNSNLIIKTNTEKWGDLKCGECTYYEFDSCSSNEMDEVLFHNVMIIRNDDKAISWFLYNDNNFSSYILFDNLEIDAHKDEHDKTNYDVESKEENSELSSNYKWWEESSTLFTCEDENGTRNLHIFVVYESDGISISFSCSSYGDDWCMFTTNNNEVNYYEENGEKFYSYTGFVRDIYENGEVVASGIEPIDNINVIYNATTKAITVSSLNELMSGDSEYPVMCSGTYSPS